MTDTSTTDEAVADTAPGGGLLGYATDAECIAASLREIGALQAEVERLQRRNRILSDDLARLLSAAASVQSQMDRDAALESTV